MEDGLPRFVRWVIASVVAIVILTATFAMSTVAVPVGQEAVLIMRPYFFGQTGCYERAVKPGREFVWWTTYSVPVNVQPVQYKVHFDDLMSSDGVPLDFDAIVRLQVTDSVKLICTFGQNWYGNNVGAEFANRVRQSVRKHGMNETAINTAAIEEIDNEISTAMEKYIADAKLPIKLIQVTVGKANPPDAIKTQRVETAAQQQRALTEGQRKLAEDARLAAEQARAKADNAYRDQIGFTPEQYLRYKNIQMMETVCRGKPNCTFLVGGDVAPVVNVAR